MDWFDWAIGITLFLAFVLLVLQLANAGHKFTEPPPPRPKRRSF